MFSKGIAALWPEIIDKESAHKAAMFGVWACVFLAGFTLFSVVSSFTSYMSLVDVLLSCVIGFLIFKNSRIASVFGVLLCVFELVDKITNRGTAGILPLFILYFINGARGTFAYYKFDKAEKEKRLLNRFSQS